MYDYSLRQMIPLAMSAKTVDPFFVFFHLAELFPSPPRFYFRYASDLLFIIQFFHAQFFRYCLAVG